MLKVGLIGVGGGMGGLHLDNWRKMRDVELIAICDIRLNAAKEKAKGENVYTDIDDMLAQEQLDILDVCTPSYLHKEHSIKALQKGIHVLTEKPAALCVDDVIEMYRVAGKNNAKLMVAHVVRFMKDYLLLKEFCVSKKYGELLHGHFSRLSAAPKWSSDNWMLDEKKSGLVPFDLHIHDCDFIYSMLGKPENVSAVRSNIKGNACFDHYIARYDYPNASVFAEAAWFDCVAYPFRADFQVAFEKAVVRMDNNGMKAYLTDGSVVDCSSIKTEENTGINLTSFDGYYEEILYFKDCVLHDKQLEALKSEEVTDVLSIITEGVKNTKINRII